MVGCTSSFHNYPSFLLTNEGFRGGGLFYWPKDSCKGDVDYLKMVDATLLHGTCALFDGNCAHEVQHYDEQNVRYSSVFYTAAGLEDITAGDYNRLVAMGFPAPSPHRLACVKVVSPSVRSSFQ